MALKTHVAFCLDESGSVAGILRALIDAYNQNMKSIRNAVLDEGQEATMTALAFGDRNLKHRIIYAGQQVQTVRELNYGDLRPSGMTPLFDSVARAIDALKQLDDGNPDTTFVVTAITDGEENASCDPGVSRTLSMMNSLVPTDRWTFTFLVPSNAAKSFSRRYGIPEGNVLPWDEKTSAGTQKALKSTSDAYGQYFRARSAGTRSTNKFFADLSHVSSKQVAQTMEDISKEIVLINVEKDGRIDDLVESKIGSYVKGTCFYQLTKTEKAVQANKLILIRDRVNGHVFVGDAARQMLGLDQSYGTVKLAPGKTGNFDVFIQSTSVNRKLIHGTQVVVWMNANK